MAEARKVVKNILMTLIDRPTVPDRIQTEVEHISELAASIQEIGLRSPIELRPKNDRYEIISGDCRYQAFSLLLRDTIPAFVTDMSDSDVLVIRATENLQRKDLTVIEEARIYKRLHDDQSMSWEQIAKRVGKSAALVKRRHDLLRMPKILQDAMHNKQIGYAVAEELSYLIDLNKIEYYLGFCIDHGATKDVVREWVKEEKSKERQSNAASGGGDWGSAIPEMRPIYVSCDLCAGPQELNTIVSMRICQSCHETIKQNM